MENLRLVPIDRSGLPVERAFELSEAAFDACRACGLLYELYGYSEPWIGYLARCGEHHVGSCAFKGPPRDGAVEIAIQTFPEFGRRGHAATMATALCAIADAEPLPLTIVAALPPEEQSVAGMLQRLGFQPEGSMQHPEDGPVIRWCRPSGVRPAGASTDADTPRIC